MPLDEDSRHLLAILTPEDSLPMHQVDIHVLRDAMESRFPDRERESIASVEDRAVAGPRGDVPVRVYRPELKDTPPVLVYFHGGGYVLGDVAQYDTLTQQLAERANCIVISVDYTLAPEAKSKQIFAEAFSVYRWLCENGLDWGVDTSRIAVGGDSAGGNLSIAVGLSCKSAHVRQPCFQLLLYPVTDYTMSFPSIEEFSSGYFLTKAGMEWFRTHFLENAERASDPMVSPHFADVAGLAPAFVVTAGFDPLRDEGVAFARKLSAAGVAVRHVCYTDMIHAFVSFAGGIEAGLEAIEESAMELRKAFSPTLS